MRKTFKYRIFSTRAQDEPRQRSSNYPTGRPSLTDTNPFLALFPIDKTSLSRSQHRIIFGVHDRRRGAEAGISAYRVLENLSGQLAECG